MVTRTTKNSSGRLCLLLISALLVSPVLAEIPYIRTGTYSYTVVHSGATTGPVTFDYNSVLGDGYTGGALSFGSGNNELGYDGVVFTFDLGQSYVIQDVEVFCYVLPWYGVSSVDFYYSQDGADFTLLGSDGDYYTTTTDYVMKERFMDYGDVSARYVKVQVHSAAWYNLRVNEIQIRVASSENHSFPSIAGLDGAKHWMWIEAEDFDWNVGFNVGYTASLSTSGGNGTPPNIANRLDGDYGDSIGYDGMYFALPADMADATLSAFYCSYYDGRYADVYLDNAYAITIPLYDTDPTGDEFASVPRAWTTPVSLGALTGGPHQFEFATRGTYNEDSYDGFYICDGPFTPSGTAAAGDWMWRMAPVIDPNEAGIAGDSVTATITINDPFEQWQIYVDGATAAGPYSDPCVCEVTITGAGSHTLMVEVFRKKTMADTTELLHGRVLSGATFRLIACGWNNEFLTGDINQDCYINLGDFAYLSQNWLVQVDPNDPNQGTVLTPDPRPAAIPVSFPLGWYTNGDGTNLAALAADGFSCVTPYGGRWSYMNAAQEAGLGVIRYISGSGADLTAFVNEYKEAPALWYWNLYDEPIGGGNPQPLAEFAANYATVKAADPDHPVTAVFCMSTLGSFINYVDFPMFDRYPIMYGDPTPDTDLYRVASETKLVAQQAVNAGKGAPIFVAQAMGGYNDTYREPTFAEQRYMTFAPITVGARGIIYYSRFDVSSAHYPNVVEIGGQLAGIVPAWESELGTGGLVVSSNRDSDSYLHGVNDVTYINRMTVEGGVTYIYMIAVNNTNTTLNNVTFTVSGLPAGSYKADVLHESRTITLVGNTLTDSFAPFAVHIYKGYAY